MKSALILLSLLVLVLAACATDEGNPAETVARYLQAKVEGNVEVINSLLCSEMESVAEREALTFSSVSGARIDAMACTYNGDETVTCTGTIVATYGTQETPFPLGTYRVVREDGEWKWCGEAAR